MRSYALDLTLDQAPGIQNLTPARVLLLRQRPQDETVEPEEIHIQVS
jgi:hypothetical protein